MAANIFLEKRVALAFHVKMGQPIKSKGFGCAKSKYSGYKAEFLI